jgi:hypothetical protein
MILPGLQIIVGTVIDHPFYGVAVIIDQEDDWIEPVTDQGR